MNKDSFLLALRNRLSGLPQEDIDASVDYYSEMIDDRIEDGLSENDAIKAIGNIEDIISQILSETSLHKLVKEKVRPKRNLKTWEIILLAVGSPVWFPIVLSLFIIFLAVYIVLWAVVIALYSCNIALAASSIVSASAAISMFLSDRTTGGVFLIGASLVCAGLAILLTLGSNRCTKGIVLASKKFLLFIKSRFIKRRDV